MKIPEYYRNTKPPFPVSNSNYGANGFFIFPHYKVVGYEIRCQCSDGMGWEHVSVTIAKCGQNSTRCPTWDEMCWVKDQFWDKQDCVIQYHPPESEYVSNHHFCLHLWRPYEKDIPMPDSIMVGIKSPQKL